MLIMNNLSVKYSEFGDLPTATCEIQITDFDVKNVELALNDNYEDIVYEIITDNFLKRRFGKYLDEIKKILMDHSPENFI